MKNFFPSPLSGALSSLFAAALFSLSGCTATEKQTTVAIVVPMEHAALREIVQGFEKTFQNHDSRIKIIVKNAYGEASMQKTIIQQFIQQKVDLIVPIGLGATQMSAHMTKDISIVSLAAKIDPKEKSSNLTGVNDELETSQILAFAKEAIPSLKKLTLIHSPSEKIFPEVQKLKVLCKELDLEAQTLMIQNLADLYPIAQAIDANSQLILVLKDHMVVSGIATLAQIAQKLHLPLMASDDGSVKEGASFALGVPEYEIGVEGAKIALRVLCGITPEDLPIQNITRVQLFINKKACEHQGLLPNDLERASARQNINTLYVE